MKFIYIALIQYALSALSIITPSDQVSFRNNLDFLGSIQCGCLLGAQTLEFEQFNHCLISGTQTRLGERGKLQ